MPLLFFVLALFEESLVLFLSVVEYEPLLNPFELPSLEDEALESDLGEELSLLLEKLPDLNPSLLFELVEPLFVLEEDLPEELPKDPELNPLLDFELLELDLLLKLDLANATVLFDVFKPENDIISKGKPENINIIVKSRVKTYFFLIL